MSSTKKWEVLHNSSIIQTKSKVCVSMKSHSVISKNSIAHSFLQMSGFFYFVMTFQPFRLSSDHVFSVKPWWEAQPRWLISAPKRVGGTQQVTPSDNFFKIKYIFIQNIYTIYIYILWSFKENISGQNQH